MDVDISLNFFGHTEEAVDFYCESIGAECIHVTRFGDSSDQFKSDPELADKIFHATLVVGSTRIMASDVGCTGDARSDANKLNFEGFALAIRVDDADQAQQFFARLSTGGNVQMPMAETFFAQCYGIVTDRFGVNWKVILEKQVPPTVTI